MERPWSKLPAKIYRQCPFMINGADLLESKPEKSRAAVTVCPPPDSR